MSSITGSRYKHVTQLIDTVDVDRARPALGSEVIPTILDCVAQVGKALRSAHQVSLVGTANSFGDEQLNVDVVAEEIIRSAAGKCASIATLSSEEDPVETRINHDTTSSEHYTLAFDPLDGSSIIAPNWTVGTIIGIWEGETALKQDPKRQIAAVLGIYGPRTTAVIAIRPSQTTGICFEVGISDLGDDFLCPIVKEKVSLASTAAIKTRYFAPANLRAAAEDEVYHKLINHYISNKYTLRYSGGLVPDILHILVKGHGIYTSPVTQASKAKLRRLYELAPIALIMECAGARAIDPSTGKDILSSAIGDCDERAGLICGTPDEVALVEQFLGFK